MIWLALSIMALEFIAKCISQVGYAELATKVWKMYCEATNNQSVIKRDQLRSAILSLRHEISLVSSVDEFAKWAKMRRRLDALTEAYDSLSGDITIEKSAFVLKVNLIFRVIIYGIRAWVGFWYFSVAVFYLPTGWFYPFEWILSLPGAPPGSLSPVVWSFVCSQVFDQGAKAYSRIYQRPRIISTPQSVSVS